MSTAVGGDERQRAAQAIDDVLVWRIVRLHQAGYDEDTAITLALARDVDLHVAVELMERGCPVETALRILL